MARISVHGGPTDATLPDPDPEPMATGAEPDATPDTPPRRGRRKP